MADIVFALFSNQIYTVPVGNNSQLNVTIPLNYLGLSADSTLPLVSVLMPYQMAADGTVLASNTSLSATAPVLTLKPGLIEYGPKSGTGTATTTVTLPTLNANTAAVVINCTITVFLNVISGVTGPYLQPTYAYTIQNPSTGVLGVDLPIGINNSQYSIANPTPSQIGVGASTTFPPGTQAHASQPTSPYLPGTTPGSKDWDVTVSVPITVTAPSQPPTTPIYLSFLYSAQLMITKN